MKLHRDIFKKDSKKIHKYLAPLMLNPIRLAHLEEMDQSEMDSNLFKTIVSGENQSCEILCGTTMEGSTQAKIITTSNGDLKMKSDAGVNRQGILQKYTSRFVENVEDNEENKEFRKILNFADVFHDDEMKIAFFHLLLEYPILEVGDKFHISLKKILKFPKIWTRIEYSNLS
jgi:hypothetical protein